MTDIALFKSRLTPIHALSPFLLTVGAIALVTALGDQLRTTLEQSSMAMVYLTTVFVVAIAFGLGASLFASVLCFLAYDFFFTPPIYQFEIDSLRDVIALFFLVLTAVTTSVLASRMRSQMLLARGLAETTRGLYGLSRELAGISRAEEIPQVTAKHIAGLLRANVVILQQRNKGLRVIAAQPDSAAFDDATIAAAQALVQK